VGQHGEQSHASLQLRCSKRNNDVAAHRPGNAQARQDFLAVETIKSATPVGLMKRYLLFGDEIYYASGSWQDFIGSSDSVEEARAAVPARHPTHLPHINIEGEWWHIDMETSEIGAISQETPY